jgi:hypothetical protein
MKEVRLIRTLGVTTLFAGAFALILGTGLSAQYAGWTIPDGGKD